MSGRNIGFVNSLSFRQIIFFHSLLVQLVVQLCIFPSSSYASPVQLTNAQEVYHTGYNIEYLTDAENKLTIEDIIAASASQFTANHTDILSLGYTTATVWVKLSVDASQLSDRDNQWIIEVNYPPLDELTFYHTNADGQFISIQTGDHSVFSQRDIKTNSFAFNVSLNPSRINHFYFQARSQGSLRIPINIYTNAAFIKEVDVKKAGFGIYAGIIFAMLLYNFFIFLSTRDQSYLYYILYVSSFILYQTNLYGLGLQYFWQNSPWWANQSLALGVAGISLFGALFARSFLNTQHYTPRLHKLLTVIAMVGACLSVWSLVANSYSAAIRPGLLLSLITLSTLLVAGIINLIAGNRMGLYFLLASISIILGGLAEILTAVGMMPSNVFTNSASLYGVCIFSLLLSFALADRINILRHEKNKAQEEAKHNLLIANKNLERSNNIKDEFIATISHELRTPMNGIICSLDLMKASDISEQLNVYLNSAADSAANMVLMIEELIGFSEIQSGTLQLEHQPFPLRECLKSIELSFGRLCQHKQLEFTFIIDEDVPNNVIGDNNQLRQMINLLLDNAIKFTEHGEIGCHVKLTENESELPFAQLDISIWDTGIGIPSAMQNHIFESFYQMNSAYNRQHGGLGIGLATCKHLASLFNGKITLCSEEGKGSQFDIYLRLDRDTSYQPSNPPVLLEEDTSVVIQSDADEQQNINELQSTHTRQKDNTSLQNSIEDQNSELSIKQVNNPIRPAKPQQILVVEDNPVNQMLLKNILLKLQYRVHTANNGQEALNIAYVERVDAILMDLQMPVMDGLEATKTIRQLEHLNNTPIIAVTANATTEDRERCFDVGMNDFLKKPVDMKTIETVLDRWLVHGNQFTEIVSDEAIQTGLK